MKPRPINLLILEEDDRLRLEAVEYISTEVLINIMGVFPSQESWQQYPEHGSPDVILTRLTGDYASDHPRLAALSEIKTMLVVIAPTKADSLPYKDLTDYFVYRCGELGEVSNEDFFGRVKYQIKNARLALSLQKGGFNGKWRMFPRGETPKPPIPPPAQHCHSTNIRLIAMGASAGGTDALMNIIPYLPEDMPPIVLVQHMPEEFIPMFARHLDGKSRMKVCLALGGEKPQRGIVYITALDKHLTVVEIAGELLLACVDGERVCGARPSVDVLFSSVAEVVGKSAVGVILTGMGADGADGIVKMRRAGAFTIGQDESSCVVYGMPAEAFRRGGIEKQLPLSDIPAQLQNAVFKAEEEAGK